ncbi:MAG: DUF3300 domain-containing protein [Dongiaceae bacterium]
MSTRLLLFLCVLLASAPASAQTGDAAPASAAAPAADAPPAEEPARLSAEELQQLLGPVALYPDALLAQVLIASAYPLEVVQAARWAEKNKALKPEQLQAALEKQAWDPSVKVVAQFPTVLAQMDKNLDWTSALGNAFVSQQEDVLAAIQELRAQAQAAGNLASGEQQTVNVTSTNNITIDPTDPEKVYVPQYAPTVYESAPAPAPASAAAGETVVAPAGSTVVTGGETTVVTQPPAYAEPYPAPYYGAYPAPYTGSDMAVAGLVGFGTGMLVGGLIWGDDDIDWDDDHVYHHGDWDDGWGGGNCGRCNNNVDIGEININNGNIGSGNRVAGDRPATKRQPWQPNAQRRQASASGGGLGAARPAAATTRRAGQQLPNANQLQNSLARGNGGAFAPESAASAKRNASRGAQSRSKAKPATLQGSPGQGGQALQKKQRPANQQARQNKPALQQNKPALGQNKPALQQKKPVARQNRPASQGGQALGNQGYGNQGAFGVQNGSRTRQASQRGQASRSRQVGGSRGGGGAPRQRSGGRGR